MNDAAKIAFAGRFMVGVVPTHLKWMTRARKPGKRCVYVALYCGMVRYWVDAKDRRYTLPSFRER